MFRGVGIVLLVGCGRIGFDAGDGATVGFCASLSPQPTFCADFDDGSEFTAWSVKAETLGQIGIDTESSSPPAALRATTSALTTTDETLSWVGIVDFAAAATRVMYAFDVRVDDHAGAGAPVFVQFELRDGALVHALEYAYVSPPGTSFIED